MPAATLRMMPARIISFWMMTSASAGTSRNVLMKYWLQRMGRGLYSRLRGLGVTRSRGGYPRNILLPHVADPQIRSNAGSAADLLCGVVRIGGAAIRLSVEGRKRD